MNNSYWTFCQFCFINFNLYYNYFRLSTRRQNEHVIYEVPAATSHVYTTERHEDIAMYTPIVLSNENDVIYSNVDTENEHHHFCDEGNVYSN